MSGKKSDHGDAVTLANILRTDADQHRRLSADTELAQSITALARAHQDATWRRSRAGNELRSLLRESCRRLRRPPRRNQRTPRPARCWPLPHPGARPHRIPSWAWRLPT